MGIVQKDNNIFSSTASTHSEIVHSEIPVILIKLSIFNCQCESITMTQKLWREVIIRTILKISTTHILDWTELFAMQDVNLKFRLFYAQFAIFSNAFPKYKVLYKKKDFSRLLTEMSEKFLIWLRQHPDNAEK